MADITIISHVAEACQITFHDPMLAIAWARTVAGELSAELYMQLFKALNADDPDTWTTAQRMVDACVGTGL